MIDNDNSVISLKWHKFNDAAELPTKRTTDVGFDVYAMEDVVLLPHETKLISTGLGCIIEPGWWLRAADRGSTGSKGIHVFSGIIDEQYTGEIFVALHNANTYKLVITSDTNSVKYVNDEEFGMMMLYPRSKGIAQLIPIQRPDVISKWASEEEWNNANATSERGDGKLGSSGK